MGPVPVVAQSWEPGLITLPGGTLSFNIRPHITSISSTAHDDTGTITGTFFDPNSQVMGDGVALSTNVTSGTSIDFVAPHNAGTVDVYVVNPGGLYSNHIDLVVS